MTFDQIIRELRGVAPNSAEEWADLRREQIAALSADERAGVTDALNDLRNYLRKLSILAHSQ